MSLHGGRSRPRWSPWSPPTSLPQACPPVSLGPSLSGGPAVAPRDGPFAESLGQWLCQGLSKPGGQRPGKMKQTPPPALSGGIFHPPEMGLQGVCRQSLQACTPRTGERGFSVAHEEARPPLIFHVSPKLAQATVTRTGKQSPFRSSCPDPCGPPPASAAFSPRGRSALPRGCPGPDSRSRPPDLPSKRRPRGRRWAAGAGGAWGSGGAAQH